MNQVSTISELLKLSDSSYRIFDMGRKVSKISKQDFEKVEQAMQPYPYPVQGHAELAIIFWQKKATTPFIWFVKFPLDERGLLNQAARNHFIAIILEALGGDLSQDPSEKQEELLKANPYNFTPAQYKLASMNSIIKRDLKQAASQYYEHCQLYFSGKLGFDNWQGVAVQGICDFAARIGEDKNEQYLIAALPHLPEQVFAPLCSALENQTLSINTINAFIELTKSTELTPARLTNILRALSANAAHQNVQALILGILNDYEAIDLNILVTISARAWLAITEIESLLLYLETLVSNVEQDIFVAIFQDLVALPAVRPALLQSIRTPERSPALSNAIGLLFSQVKG
ncbi:DUF3549 family protein [Thalassomonas sp. M1454]|uniref:DUF3549 family protein n=1 Tax=Thalassomonas sp. M1454 TaxID=2594477 RepID=UPI00117F1D78|nr:DUF3549 family protein [Thalassomonas sp. M1454]TRX56390.1 DUF3549 family protein [Thalassomonas sp. M1454]